MSQSKRKARGSIDSTTVQKDETKTTQIEIKQKDNDGNIHDTMLTYKEYQLRTELMDMLWGNKTNDFKQLIEKIKLNSMVNLQKILDSQDHNFLIIIAASKNNLDIIKILIENKCNINVIDEHNRNAIFAACYNNNTQMCKFLMENGADPNCVTKGNETTLSRAAGKGNKQMMQILLNIDNKFQRSFDWVCINKYYTYILFTA